MTEAWVKGCAAVHADLNGAGCYIIRIIHWWVFGGHRCVSLVGHLDRLLWQIVASSLRVEWLCIYDYKIIICGSNPPPAGPFLCKVCMLCLCLHCFLLFPPTVQGLAVRSADVSKTACEHECVCLCVALTEAGDVSSNTSTAVLQQSLDGWTSLYSITYLIIL